LVFVVPRFDELARGEVAVRRVRQVDVVVDSPVLDDRLGFERAIEASAVQKLVAQAAAARFDPGVPQW
jgi:hypothetical protein